MDLEKVYDNVDKHPLLEVAEEWLDGHLRNTVLEMLGPLHVHTKSDPNI